LLDGLLQGEGLVWLIGVVVCPCIAPWVQMFTDTDCDTLCYRDPRNNAYYLRYVKLLYDDDDDDWLMLICCHFWAYHGCWSWVV